MNKLKREREGGGKVNGYNTKHALIHMEYI